jgi:hypothetical protein
MLDEEWAKAIKKLQEQIYDLGNALIFSNAAPSEDDQNAVLDELAHCMDRLMEIRANFTRPEPPTYRQVDDIPF